MGKNYQPRDIHTRIYTINECTREKEKILERAFKVRFVLILLWTPF